MTRRAIALILAAIPAAGGAPRTALAQSSDSETLLLTETPAPPKTATGAVTLSQLVAEALENNLRVAIDRAQIEEARALYEFAASQAYPRASGNAIFGGPTPEQRTTVVNDPSTITPDSLEGDLDFGGLGVTFRLNAEAALPIYAFGKIDAAKEAANNLVRAAGHKVTITQAEVAMNVHRAFWAHQLTRAFVVSLRDGEKTLIKVLKRIEELLDEDSQQVTENDRLRMLYALATVRVKLAEAQRANDLSRDALKLLVGRPQTDELGVADADLDELPPEIPSLEPLTKSAQLDRPELRAMRSVVDAHEKFADYRRDAFFPDLFLGGVLRYAYTSNSTNQTNPFIFDDANYFEAGIGLGLRFELDVFTKLAQLEQAEAAAETRTREEAAISQAVDFEVRKLHSDLTNGYQRIALLERANRSARGWLTASTLAYDIGTGDAAELIDSFLAWAASEGELQKVRYDMQIAHADLARAAGRLVGARADKTGEPSR
jgi:outer membrane protein TolC